MKIPYYVRDVYSLNNHIIFENEDKLRIGMTSRTIKNKMFSNYPVLFDSKKIINAENPHMTMYVHYDKSFKNDSYELKITRDNRISIRAVNERGIRYAIRLLNDLVEIKNKNVYVPVIHVYDEPSFEVRGIIEGFYGTPWSHENRLDVINYMDSNKMNAFMYAPKDDEYHRNKWRELYPEKELSELLEYKNSCNEKNIDFYYCISPGNDFNYASEEEFQVLYRKLDQVIENGIRNFSLLMDDINYKMSEENTNKFIRSGIAHSFITNKINRYLQEKIIDSKLIMCPTEYHQNWDSEYRNDLATRIDEDVAIFFTGDNVCAEVIDNNKAKEMREVFNHDVALWENFPVNDFLTKRIFLSPLTNRGTKLSEHFKIMVSNPMNQWQASKIGVKSVADYMWNSEKYNPDYSFEEALKEAVPAEYVDDFRIFAHANYANIFTEFRLQTQKEWVDNDDFKAIDNHYNVLKESSEKLLTLDIELITEIKPWLERAIFEANTYQSLIDGNYNKEDLIKRLTEDVILGDELFNMLLRKNNVLTQEEYNERVRKHTGTRWWRVWEEI